MAYLITGGAGFIGSHIADALIKEGNQVRVFDDLSSGNLDNIQHLMGNPNFTFIEGDVRNLEFLSSSVEGVSGIFHEAAFVSAPKSINDPVLSFSINCIGTFNVFEAARKHSVSKVLFASSASVYGNNINLPLYESEPLDPLTPYALDKSYAEQLGKLYWKLYGVSSCALRYFNVFGPRQVPNSSYSGVISNFVHALENNKRPKIDGDGEQGRDFVYVKDVVQANIIAMTADSVKEFQVFNVGTGKQHSINCLLQTLLALSKSDVQPIYTDSRVGDIKYSLANIDKIKSTLGYFPRWSFEGGLSELLESVGFQRNAQGLNEKLIVDGENR